MGNYVPNGSYKLTCNNINVKLTCKAQKIDGNWINASFDLTDVSNVDLWNDNGVLKNSGTVKPSGYIPAGSYKLTCKNINVKLTCKAQKIDGNWIDASFDLTNVPEADLWNDNGVLKNSYKTIAVYVPGAFYSGENADNIINNLRSSKFNTVIAWAFHVSAQGDITNQGNLVQNGKYVGNKKWAERLEKLKQNPSSVNRLLFSIWSGDFINIKNLIFPNGTDTPQIGPGTTLYESFNALKQAIPSVDGIDFDDESLYDKPTIVAFSRMLSTLGYQVTFCPYTEMIFWVDCLSEIYTNTPSVVTGFNLQCYNGGGENDPKDWVQAIKENMNNGFDAEGFVYPGAGINWNGATRRNNPGTPEQIESDFKSWNSEYSLPGGFIWNYDDIESSYTPKQFAEAMINGIGS